MILNCFKMTVVPTNLVLLPFKVMNTPKPSSILKITHVIYFLGGGGGGQEVPWEILALLKLALGSLCTPVLTLIASMS